MRENVYAKTEERVSEFFNSNSSEFSQTWLMNTLHVDYKSLSIILDKMLKKGLIVKDGNKYRRKK